MFPKQSEFQFAVELTKSYRHRYGPWVQRQFLFLPDAYVLELQRYY